MSQDKTEKPTPKKLKDARKKGQVVRSRDLAVAAATLAAILTLGRLGGWMMSGLAERLTRDLTHFGDTPLAVISAGDVNGLVISGILAMAVLVGPIAVATMSIGVAAQTLQGGFNFAPEALQPKLSRLSPMAGLKKLGFKQNGAETLKTFGSVAAIAWLAWGTVNAVMIDGSRMAWMSPVGAAVTGWTYTESLLWKVAVALGLLAIGDYGLQHWRVMSSLKMTKQEVRDEAKQNDGSPEMKMRIRRVQRDMARRRMINDVARATVVITNPTHFAVALEYKKGSMAAPMVLAKGADHIAAAIREQARQHGVPMIENKPLAQTLFKTAEVGEAIPAALFAAVAEVLAQLIRNKRLSL